jgi:two-component system, HptB-dependent secretion and biofilm response regulator
MNRHSPLLEKPTILVVDDTPDNLSLMSRLLKDNYKVKVANDGEKALRIAQSDSPPDLILLDIMMPEMDGFEVMRHLRADPATSDIPVIFITGLSDSVNEIHGLSIGAVDYVAKPINPPVVLARVATHLALRDARHLLEQRNAELARERTVVENIIIRMRAHRQFDESHLRYLIAPVERTNGDILLAAITPDGRQWVLVGDFTGHGLPAAAAGPLVSHIFYRAAAQNGDAVTALAELNGVLAAQLPAEMFMVACFVEVDAARRALRLWNAGVPECLLAGGSPRQIHSVPASGLLPLGIIADINFADGCTPLSCLPGERLYIHSDGVSEIHNTTGELFGTARLATHLAAMPDNANLDGLLSELEHFAAGCPFHDDITLVEITL